MATRVPWVDQGLGHWLSRAVYPRATLDAPLPTDATDGNPSDGAGFREPPPEPDWMSSDGDNPTTPTEAARHPPREHNEPRPSSKRPLDPIGWTQLQQEIRRTPRLSATAGLRRYRQSTQGSGKTKRFRKGIVVDDAG